MRLNSTTGKRWGFMDWLASLHEPKTAAAEYDEASPFLVEFFMVEGAGFQCMAYRDFDGKWHHAFNNRELPGRVHVLE